MVSDEQLTKLKNNINSVLSKCKQVPIGGDVCHRLGKIYSYGEGERGCPEYGNHIKIACLERGAI